MEPTSNQTQPNTLQSLAIPFAIIFGFALIAGAIYFTGSKTAPAQNPLVAESPTPTQPAQGKIRPVDETDYIKGNPNAPILIVEYSDYDCPFCKSFHDTMTQIMDEYGQSAKVAWVYRQFPLRQLHPNAERISQAALCVGEIGGNDAFWKFSDLIFFSRGTNEPTDISQLPRYATESGVSEADLVKCLESGKHVETIQNTLRDGANAGIGGTPQSFVIVGNQMAPIEGAQPYAVVKQIIDNLLGQLESGQISSETTTN